MILDIDTLIRRTAWKSPVFASFIIDKYKDLEKTDTKSAAKIEARVFTPEFIRAVLETASRLTQQIMFSTLPGRCFVPVMNELIPLFEDEPFSETGRGLKRVIKANEPDLYFKTLKAGIEDAIESRPVTLNNFHWMQWGLSLPREDNTGYFERTCPLIEESRDNLAEDDDFRNVLGNMVNTALKLERPEAFPLAKSFLEELARDYDQMDLEYYEVADALHNVLAPKQHGRDGTFELNLFLDLEDRHIKSMPAVVRGLYSKDKPGEQMFTLFEALAGARGHVVDASMVLHHVDAMGSPLLASLIRTLLRDKALMLKLESLELHHLVMAVFVGIIWRFHRKEAIDADWFTQQNIRELLSLNTDYLPCADGIKTALAAMDSLERAELLAAAMDNILNLPDRGVYGNFAIKNIISLMGQFPDEVCLPLLTGFLAYDNEDYDSLVDAAGKILPKFGNAALDHIEAVMEKIPEFALIRVLEIIRLVDTPEAEAFLMAHFGRFNSRHRADTLDTAKYIMSQQVLERVAAKVGIGQPGIDEFYVIVSTLNGQADERTGELLAGLPVPGTEFEDTMDLMASREARDILPLELKCGCCGDVAQYECSRVIASPSSEAYVAEELTCLNCNKVCEFRLTASGSLGIIAELFRLSTFSKEEGKGDGNPFTGALQMANTAVMGRPMSVPEGIDLYKARIEKKPRQPDNYISLGNIYKVWNQFTLAAEQYEKAIAVGPFYIEAYYSLAQMTVDQDESTLALAWLEKGRIYLSRPLVCKDIQMTAEDIMDGYLDLHGRLLAETGSKIRPIRPSEFMPCGKSLTKIGRNEKCPCGSDKKYKKCCMRKH